MRGKQLLGRVAVVAACALLVGCGGRGAAGVRAPAGGGHPTGEAPGEAPVVPFALAKPSCPDFDECRDRCEAKQLPSCVWAGRFADRSGERAKLWSKACAAGSEEACAYLEVTPPGTTLHLRRVDRACAAGVAEACERLGWAYQHGESVPLDAAKGAAYYAHAAKRYLAACELGSSVDCTGAAALLDDGAGVTRDTARADALYQRACQLGDREGCERAGASAHSSADADAACKPGATEACNRVGLRYEVGRGIELDPARAAAAYKKACDQKDERGCALLGYSYEAGIGVPADEIQARRLYVEACDAHEEQGCYGLARFYRAGKGGLFIDDKQAAMLFAETCRKTDDGLGCRELTEMYESGHAKNTSGESIVTLYEKSCTGGDSLACARGGAVLAEGKALTRDATRALGFYDRGCKQGYGPACYAAGKIFADGDLVPEDPDAAFVWFQRGCEAHDSESCAAMTPQVLAPRKRFAPPTKAK